MSELRTMDIGMDELEALRLADMLSLSQTEAANMMNVSQPTFNRILASARQKTAECIVTGLAIRIQSPETSNSVLDNSRTVPWGSAAGPRRRGQGR
jgi:predicted DNA-binding protein (UPF0251 family)